MRYTSRTSPSLDILARGEQPIAAFQASPKADGVASSTYLGSDISDVTEARPQQTPNGPGYDLNFENLPVATVLKVMLGDILGLGYTIDPREQATISLVSARPVPRSDIVLCSRARCDFPALRWHAMAADTK
ncbi:hypothetical protein [Bradyrhizobium sp. B117]|uniref:hypothetical protein n=1 Tax=Bradyrhizobium sp. B117 TaxID=3140246 RepID=UPI0031839E0D